MPICEPPDSRATVFQIFYVVSLYSEVVTLKSLAAGVRVVDFLAKLAGH